MKSNKSSLVKYLFFTFVFIFLFSAAIGNAGAQEKKQKLHKPALPSNFSVICDVGNLACQILYNEYIGESSMSDIPSMEWPKGSKNHYLWIGQFWYYFKDEDNVVQNGVAGPQIYDPQYDPPGIYDYDGLILRSTNDPNDELAVSALDTESSWTSWPPPDSLEFRSGLRVVKKTHAWAEEYRDDFIIWELILTNVKNDSINDLFIGNRMDYDIS